MVTQKAASIPCPRCQGRMFAENEQADRVCFTCGNVVYATAIPSLEEMKSWPKPGRRK